MAAVARPGRRFRGRILRHRTPAHADR
jgi:hypothetical protein